MVVAAAVLTTQPLALVGLVVCGVAPEAVVVLL